MKQFISHFLKGAAMGAANVVPGVSGGTVAFIFGVYERLINAIKSCDLTAVKLLFTGKLKEFTQRIDLWFLAALGLGVITSIVTLARVFEYCFAHQPVLVYSFFFGLILSSIYFVGKRVKRWSAIQITALLIGTTIAVGVALLTPAQENASTPYLLLCGVVAMASMIIPGLSGSFVLLLMGNYALVMIHSVNQLSSGDLSCLKVLIPVGIGSVLGLVALSHLLAWIFKNYHDTAVALLTGFVAGSLLVIWPWKNEKTIPFEKAGETKLKTIGYEWYIPDLSTLTWIAIGLIIAGILLVWMMEKFGAVPTGEVESSPENTEPGS